jgi:uncharacterized protein DUF6130
MREAAHTAGKASDNASKQQITHRRDSESNSHAESVVDDALPTSSQSKGNDAMTMLIKTLAAVVAGTVIGASAFAQSARDIRGASPFETIENEPAAKLIMDPPLPGPLAQGQFLVQYRTENVRLLQVFGPGALSVSPRIGHLHVNVNDLPWLWADASDNNTVDIAGFPPGTR